ncbi:MAG: tRNA lysidine(34) synthetase TilS [Desulfomonile tiedjei]|uniref:tRNA(Ile)-lysidine synthase n=1 Tax=Desulfomonile tiedjei TaxID=2358 RepID=A0A9D6V7Z0_9BACT|nr:tRNA lysidine(34) synthetase TilS [Desulfomonile tiedjei]
MAYSKKENSLTESVKALITQYRMIEPGSMVVIAVSGGPDSTALMRILSSLTSQLDFGIVVAHLDHALRADSFADAEFTAHAAADLGLPCRIKRVDVRALAADRSMSLEEAGRMARYEFFAEVAEEFSASTIATAHHLDDEIETFFLRIFRGSSIQGLQGIRPAHRRIIRPFIRTTRSEILNYAESQSIEYRTDPTNLETTTDRNFIRGRVLPCVRERFPSFKKPLERTMELLRQEEDYVAGLAEQLYKETVTQKESGLSLNITRLREAHTVLVSRVILSALYKVCGQQVRVGRVHIKSATSLVYSAKPSGSVTLPGNLFLRRNYEELLIATKRPEAFETRHQIEITGPGVYEFPPSGFKIRIRLAVRREHDPKDADGKHRAVFDAKNAAFPLILRSTLTGDRFHPWGMGGSRKLKKIFIDLKIPRDQRKSIPLLVKDGEILWIAGVRRGRGARVTPKTSQVLEVENI